MVGEGVPGVKSTEQGAHDPKSVSMEEQQEDCAPRSRNRDSCKHRPIKK